MKLLPRNEKERLLTPPLTFAPRQVFVYPSRSPNEVYRIVVVAVDSGSYRQHVGIEYNVARR